MHKMHLTKLSIHLWLKLKDEIKMEEYKDGEAIPPLKKTITIISTCGAILTETNWRLTGRLLKRQDSIKNHKELVGWEKKWSGKDLFP